MAKQPTHLTLYDGPSMLDGAPIVVLAILKSSNRKTGNMIQTYIMRKDVDPVKAAYKTGDDKSVCGNCPHRPALGGTCYVNLGQGVLMTYRAYKRGNYPMIQEDQWELFRGRSIRFGAYGDPAAAPEYIWKRLAELASKHSGYTHQWQFSSVDWSPYVMASVDTPTQQVLANLMGYRTFRVKSPDMPNLKNEISCPASTEMNNRTTCEQCGLCAGTQSRGKNISINAHGKTKMNFSEARIDQLMEV